MSTYRIEGSDHWGRLVQVGLTIHLLSVDLVLWPLNSLRVAFLVLHLFLLVFSCFLKFCGNLALSKCGLLWHLSLRIIQAKRETLVKERNLFFECFIPFLSFGREQFFHSSLISLIVCSLCFVFV